MQAVVGLKLNRVQRFWSQSWQIDYVEIVGVIPNGFF